MKGKIVTALAAAVFFSAIGLAGTGSASAAPQVNNVTNGRLCDTFPTATGQFLCWANDGVAKDPVTTQPYRAGSQDQAINVNAPTNATCGNNIVNANTSCPFYAGSGLNTMFNGDLIVNINNADSGLRYESNTAGTGVIANSQDDTTGSLWVQVGCTDPATACAPAEFVNVYASNKIHTGAPAWAFTQGDGKQVGIGPEPSCYVSGTKFFNTCP